VLHGPHTVLCLCYFECDSKQVQKKDREGRETPKLQNTTTDCLAVRLRRASRCLHSLTILLCPIVEEQKPVRNMATHVRF